MTMIEKVARAICCPEGCVAGDRKRPCTAREWNDEAKAALQSLLPPDEGTVEAMEDALWANCDPWDGPKTEDAKSALTAAINHILKEDA